MAKVKAIAVGFHDKLYKPGDEFEFSLNKDKSNLGSWMEVVKVPRKSKPKDTED